MPPVPAPAGKSAAQNASTAANQTTPPANSPAVDAAKTTPATISEDQKQLRASAIKRMPRTVDQIKSVAGLAKYKPTQTQRDFMLKQLRDAVQVVEDAFNGVAPEVVSFDFPE